MVRAQALRLGWRAPGHLAGVGRHFGLSGHRRRSDAAVEPQPVGGRIDHRHGHRDVHRGPGENDARRFPLALGRQGMTSLLILAAALAAAPIERPLTAPGPQALLAGTLLDAGKGSPVILIVPGSGPTDRDGNNPLGVTAAPYRLLAEALAQRGSSPGAHDQHGRVVS